MTVAVRVFAPAVVPRVHPPTVATPFESVVCVAPVTDPPPLVTANVTCTPETPLPYESVTVTVGFTLNRDPAGATWLSPPLVSFAGDPAVAVALNVSGLPE